MDRFDLNDINAATLGVTFLDGVYSELIKFPETKEDLVNDWKDQHGEEVDLTARCYKSRVIALRILISGNNKQDYLAKKQALIDLVAVGRFNLKAHAINRQFDLRYLSASAEKDYGNHGEVVLNVKDDYPQLNTPIS